MKIVNLIQKLGLTLGLLVMANHAVAAIYDLSGTGWYGADVEEGQAFYAYESFGALESVGPFNDSFIFTAPEGDVWNFYAYAKNWDGKIDGFTEILFQGSAGEVGDTYAKIGTDPLDFLVLEAVSDSEIIIGPGVYSVSVSGVSSMPYAEYGMIIYLISAVSPVPEPSSIALMLGGLGLVGFMAARRRQQA